MAQYLFTKIFSIVKWIGTSRLSIKNSLCGYRTVSRSGMTKTASRGLLPTRTKEIGNLSPNTGLSAAHATHCAT